MPFGDTFARLNKDFKDLGGYSFDGLSGVPKASECLDKYTLVFGLMKLTSIPRRELAVHNLCGSALLWWFGLGVDFIGSASWEDFLVGFVSQMILRSRSVFWLRLIVLVLLFIPVV